MLAPVPMIGFVAVVLLVLDILALQFLSGLPHPDQSFVTDGQQVFISADHGQGQLLTLESIHAGDLQIKILPTDLIEEPDVLPTRQETLTFFQRQSTIFDILTSGEAMAETNNGTMPITFHKESLPGVPGFWMQLLVANIGVLVGFAVWTFQRTNFAARHLAVTGTGLALSALAAAIYSSRPLAINGEIFAFLSMVNAAGVVIFCGGFLPMMWNYPKPLWRHTLAPFWYLALAFLFFGGQTGWIDSNDISLRLAPIFALLAGGAVLLLQWRQSKRDPLTKQSLLWFMLVTLSGSTFFVAAVMIPPLFGLDTAVSQGAAFLAFLTIYIGLAVGVARYPLFDLQQYWVKSMIWLIAGLLVIAANIAIILFLGLSLATAGIMVLVSIVLLVIPLRAVGARYVFNRASKNFQQHLPQIVARMSESQEKDVESIWQTQIREIFSPLEFSVEKIPVVRSLVVKRGLGFVVPALEGNTSYHMTYADQGTRLFSSLDVTLVETLIELFEMNLSARRVASEAALQERGRMRKDIHDSLGGRLLSIMHAAPDNQVAEESRRAMSELRDILAAVDSESTNFGIAAHEWEKQLRGQVESSGAEFLWSIDPELNGIALAGRDRFNLGQIIREAVTNGMRHAAAQHISVQLKLEPALLVCIVTNDGNVSSLGFGEAGLGRRNMRERALELGGTVEWIVQTGEVQVILSVPVGDGVTLR